jgi:hypothetical protein
MIRFQSESSDPTAVRQAWQAGFLAFLPAIQRHARVAFSHLDAEAREEAVQEVVVYALVTYLRLAELNKLELAYPAVLARFGVARVKHGRQMATRLNTNDMLSPYAQRRKGFRVGRLDHFDSEEAQWKEVLVEDRRTPVPDQAAFRIDFPAWLESQPLRKRRIAEALALGHSTGKVAKRFSVSPGRVSQLRRELDRSWHQFHGEEVSHFPVSEREENE